MKLLLDENLSPFLAKSLADLFPGTTHVNNCGLGAADDLRIWQYAKSQGFAIASKDSDFSDMGALFGSPPKVVWLRVGNCNTEQIEETLRRSKPLIDAFAGSSETVLLLYPYGIHPLP